MDPLLTSFEALVARQPEALAVVVGSSDPCVDLDAEDRSDASTGQRWTRADLDQAARELERRWARPGPTGTPSSGLAPGHVVVLNLPPGPGFLAAWIAIRRAGACALLADPGLTAAELERIQRTLPPDFRVVPREGRGERRTTVTGLDLDLEPVDRGDARQDPARPAALHAAAIVKLTSGTSGTPRGVIMLPEHLQVDGLQLQASMGFDGTDRFLCVIPFTHSYGFSLLPTSLFLFGCPLVIPGSLDPLECARREGATVLPGVPAWYRARLRLIDGNFHRNFRWPETLRLYCTAGEPMPSDVARAWRSASGRPIQALYGTSECGGIAFDRTGDSTEAGRVGTAVEGVELELLNEMETSVPSRSGTETTARGTVLVRSEGIAAGYWPASGVSDAHLRPAKPPQRLGSFQTEDIGRFHGAELELLGRLSAWINVSGKKVDPREVEATIALMDDVDEVAVYGFLDDSGVERVRAVVASSADTPPSYLTISSWCRRHLTAYKVPRSILVVRGLPRNERGKIDMRRLITP